MHNLTHYTICAIYKRSVSKLALSDSYEGDYIINL